MKKHFLKTRLFFLIFFLFLSSLFISLPQSSFTLEVNYPIIPTTGASITNQSGLEEYLKYVLDFGISLGFFLAFISLIIAGIQYFLGGASPHLLQEAKDRITGTISGILILALLYLIIITINPTLRTFKVSPLEEIPEPETEEPIIPGVYFYKKPNCEGEYHFYTSNVNDFKELTNNIRSVKIVSNTLNNSYTAILFDNPNFWGKCLYISRYKPCINVDPWAASAIIYPYSPNPSGDVIIFRKSYFQNGYKKITEKMVEGGEKGGKYFPLSSLNFTDPDNKEACKKDPECCTVPKEEKDCTQYDITGECLKYTCPKLDKDNITSIQTGNYLVVLVYYAPGDPYWGPYTYCQAYPSNDDTDKIGPAQIKWDAIRNINHDPNWILIIPIRK